MLLKRLFPIRINPDFTHTFCMKTTKALVLTFDSDWYEFCAEISMIQHIILLFRDIFCFASTFQTINLLWSRETSRGQDMPFITRMTILVPSATRLKMSLTKRNGGSGDENGE